FAVVAQGKPSSSWAWIGSHHRPLCHQGHPKGSRYLRHPGRAWSGARLGVQVASVNATTRTATMRRLDSFIQPLSVRSWAWMDLNHRPLPYQGERRVSLTSAFRKRPAQRMRHMRHEGRLRTWRYMVCHRV